MMRVKLRPLVMLGVAAFTGITAIPAFADNTVGKVIDKAIEFKQDIGKKKTELQGRVMQNTALEQKKQYKQQTRDMQTKEYLQVHKIGDQTFVNGLVVHQGNVHERGENAEAVGAELKVQEEGTVHINATLINTGTVIAEGKSNASATGAKVSVENGNTGNVTVRSVVNGDVSATARNQGNANAEAIGTQVETTGGAHSSVNVKHRSNAAIQAIAESN